MDEGPCFFKIIVTGLTTEELRIPPRFMKHIKKEGCNTATLKGPSGGCWRVKLGQKGNGTFLQEGWQEFIRGNSIKEADFLLFTYEGDLSFNVQIFDRSGLERIGTCDAGKQLEAASSGAKEKQVGSPRKGSIDHPLKPQQSNVSGNGTGDRIHEEAKPSNGKRKQGRPRKAIAESVHPSPSGEEVARAWERSKSYTTNFPHYRCCLKELHVHKFILPISEPFPRTRFPPFEASIVLKNSKGEGSPVNVAVSERPSFSGGWCSFVLDNNLRQGDICIFELVHTNEMQVHIFRRSPLDDILLVPRLR